MNSLKNTVVLICTLLLLPGTGAFADLGLDIPPIKQDETLWCWAACCKMVLDAYFPYYSTPTQQEIANWAVNGNNEGNSLYGTDKSVDKVLEHFGDDVNDLPIYSHPTQNPSGTAWRCLMIPGVQQRAHIKSLSAG